MQREDEPGASHGARAGDIEAIRCQIARGIATNRIPGLHFPGFFLNIGRRRFEREGVSLVLPTGPHCTGADARTSLLALGPFADIVLASAVRPFISPAERTATIGIHLSFTGVAPRGELVADTRCFGFSQDSVLPQAYCSGTISSAAGVVCHGSGRFARLESPAGVELHPLPWARAAMPPVPAIGPRDYTATERAIDRRAQACLANLGPDDSFIERFWGGRITVAEGTARGVFPLGPHTGNRVGHVQGGLMASFAAITACAAVPRHQLLESLAAWYISPGHGTRLTARSRVLQDGRNLAVVRTQVFAAGRKRVLEVVTNHAVARRRDPQHR